jgi:Putative phage tail protein
MATLALSLAGAGLGSFTGVGAGAGWQIGSTLGRLFFPSNKSGATPLNDLKISGASYGSVVPKLMGTMKVAGNVIWAGPTEQVSQPQQGGGKGSAAAAPTTGTVYHANFAIAFAQGEMGGLVQIFADGNLIYDAQGTAVKRQNGLHFRYYSGSETQQADGLIESVLGDGNTPAYRGICYVVFDSLPLAPYGNRLPNIEVVLTHKGVPVFPQKAGQSLLSSPQQYAVDDNRGVIYTYHYENSNEYFRKIDAGNLTKVDERQAGVNFPNLPAAAYGLSLDRDGNLWLGTGLGIIGNRHIYRYNPEVGQILASRQLPTDVGAISASVDIQDPIGGKRLQVAGSQQSGQIVVFDPDLNVEDTLTNLSPACTGRVRDKAENAWLVMSGIQVKYPLNSVDIVKVSTVARPDNASGLGAVFQKFTLSQNVLTPSNLSLPIAHNVTNLLAYLPDRQELVLMNPYRIFKWSLLTQTVTAVLDIVGLGYIAVPQQKSDDTLVVRKGAATLIYLSCDDLQEVERIDLAAFTGISSIDDMIYDDQSDSAVLFKAGQSIRKVYLRRLAGSRISFAAAIVELLTLTDFNQSDIDVTAVTGDVGGLILNRNGSVQDMIEPILLAGHLDICESGYKLKFVPKGQPPVDILTDSDFIGAPEKTRLQEAELPGLVTVSYMAADGGYQAGAQSAKRAYAPFATMFGRNDTLVGLPMALDAVQAKAIATKSLYSAWSERSLYRYGLPTKYLALDPTDNISVTSGDVTYQMRLSQMHLGLDFVTDAEAVGHNVTNALPSLVADAGTGYQMQPIQNPPNLELFLPNLPLLRDEDAITTGASRFYFALSTRNANWQGGALFLSEIGTRYTQKGSSQQSAAWGGCQTVLPPVTDPWRTDRYSRIQVRFVSGEDKIESISHSEMLSGANVILIGNEIIQFSKVIWLSDGSAELSDLLRGRRGTEDAIQNHGVGERAMLLDPSYLQRNTVALSFLNKTHYWKAVSAGQLLEDAKVVRQQLRGRDLQPYAPVHIRGSRQVNGDLDIEWQRRTRIGGDRFVVAAPLSEARESYELEFEYLGTRVSKFKHDAIGFSYSLAQFNSDFSLSESAIPQLDLILYQLSETVGRGIPAKETL